MTSSQTLAFAERIRQLELQGAGLLNAAPVVNAPYGQQLKLQSTSLLNEAPLSSIMWQQMPGSDSHANLALRLPSQSTALSASSSLLSDSDRLSLVISETDETVDLRSQLESQSKDTKLLLDALAGRDLATNFLSHPLPAAVCVYASKYPSVGKSKCSASWTRDKSTEPESKLPGASDQTHSLTRELSKADNKCNQQQAQFTSTLEELNRRLCEATLERDSLRVACSNGSSQTRVPPPNMQPAQTPNNDAAVVRLQTTVQAQHEAGRAQERALVEANARLERLQEALAEHEKLAAALRSALTDIGGRRGLTREGRVNDAHASELPTMLERCLDELDDQSEKQSSRIRELELQLDDLRGMSKEREDAHSREAEGRIARMRDEYEKRLSDLEERAINTGRQSSSLRSHGAALQEKLQQQAKAAAQRSQELEEANAKLTNELLLGKKECNEKLRSLKKAVDDAQRELAKATSQSNEAVQRAAALESRTSSYELVIERLGQECEQARQEAQQQWQREEELGRHRDSAESKLAERDTEVARLMRLIDVVKDECSAQLKGELNMMERHEREQFKEERLLLQRQLDTATEHNKNMAAEMQVACNERARMADELRTLRQRHDAINANLHAAAATSDELRTRLAAEVADARRLASERDSLAAALTECQREASETRPRAALLAARLESVEASMQSERKRVESLTSALASKERAAGDSVAELMRVREESRELAQRVQDLMATEELTKKRAKASERRLASKESDCNRLDELLRHKTDMMQHAEKELEERQAELAECRRDVATLNDERNALASMLKGQEGEMQQQIHELLGKIKAIEHDHKLARKMLRAKSSFEKTATLAAGKLQTELQEVRSKLQNKKNEAGSVKEQLNALLKEKEILRSDNRQLADVVAAVNLKFKEANAAMMAGESRSLQLQDKIMALEGSLTLAVDRYQAASLPPMGQPRAELRIDECAAMGDHAQKTSSPLPDRVVVLLPAQAVPVAPSIGISNTGIASPPECEPAQCLTQLEKAPAKALGLANDMQSLLVDIEAILAANVYQPGIRAGTKGLGGGTGHDVAAPVRSKGNTRPVGHSATTATQHSAQHVKDLSVVLKAKHKKKGAHRSQQKSLTAAQSVVAVNSNELLHGNDGDAKAQSAGTQEGNLKAKARLLCQELGAKLSKLTRDDGRLRLTDSGAVKGSRLKKVLR